METKIINEHSHHLIVDHQGIRVIKWKPAAVKFVGDAADQGAGICREDAIWLRDALLRQFPLDGEVIQCTSISPKPHGEPRRRCTLPEGHVGYHASPEHQLTWGVKARIDAWPEDGGAPRMVFDRPGQDEERMCGKCGRPLPDGSRTCRWCGKEDR